MTVHVDPHDYGLLGQQIFNDFIAARGETAREKVDRVLHDRGWDELIESIPDPECVEAIKFAFERLAVSPRKLGGKSADIIERERRQKDVEAFARSGHVGDLLGDRIVGLSTEELRKHLPSEVYWVEALGRHVPREELAENLTALQEIRAKTWRSWRASQDVSDAWNVELAILDELIARCRK
ncbi:MAG: hypothetical protein M9955_04505 [Rhizobiaceae bacterium]|nr:hypothetical protein [Rhizobiaceae bacterium]